MLNTIICENNISTIKCIEGNICLYIKHNKSIIVSIVSCFKTIPELEKENVSRFAETVFASHVIVYLGRQGRNRIMPRITRFTKLCLLIAESLLEKEQIAERAVFTAL